MAAALLAYGLPHVAGCVYLDHEDRKMILLREGSVVMKLEQCGLDRSQRFSFFDQVHAIYAHYGGTMLTMWRLPLLLGARHSALYSLCLCSLSLIHI